MALDKRMNAPVSGENFTAARGFAQLQATGKWRNCTAVTAFLTLSQVRRRRRFSFLYTNKEKQ